MNFCDYFLLECLKVHVYCTSLLTVMELQAEIGDVAEEITGNILCDTFDNFVVCLQ